MQNKNYSPTQVKKDNPKNEYIYMAEILNNYNYVKISSTAPTSSNKALAKDSYPNATTNWTNSANPH